jgi:hypothetical protein
MELLQRIANHKAEHFAATAVPAEKLAKLGKFFSLLADLKKFGVVNPRPITVLDSNCTVSVGQSAEDMKAQRPARDADLDASVATLLRKNVDD